MIEIVQFILTTMGIGVLFSIPGILLGYWLKKTNRAPNRSWLTIIFCIIITFVKRIWLADSSYYGLAVILLIGSTLGVYQMDIYWATSSKKPSK